MSHKLFDYTTAADRAVPVEGIAGGRWQRVRVRFFYQALRRPVLARLAEMMPAVFWPPEQLAEYQRARLLALLRHAAAEVPYYRETLAKVNLDLPTPALLASLPILTREMLRTWEKELLVESASKNQLLRQASGGSTGQPVVHWIDEKEHMLKGARERRSFAFQGLPLGERLLRVWGARADFAGRSGLLKHWADRVLRNQIWFNAYELGEATTRECVDLLRSWRPRGIFGYALAVQEVARWILRNKQSVPSPQVVITSAEHLYEDARKEIHQAFGCPVLDSYGCREAGVIAWECRERGGLHIDADQVIVEILREGQPVAPGEEGHIVITPLQAYAMPLLRYDVGDVGRLLPEPCSCGIQLPRMEISVGRTVELLTTPDGRIVHGLMLAPHNIRAPGLHQIQIEQTAVDHLIVRVVGDLAKARPYLERDLVGKVHQTMGEQVKVEFQAVADIPLSATGKRVFILSRVAPVLRREDQIEV